MKGFISHPRGFWFRWWVKHTVRVDLDVVRNDLCNFRSEHFRIILVEPINQSSCTEQNASAAKFNNWSYFYMHQFVTAAMELLPLEKIIFSSCLQFLFTMPENHRSIGPLVVSLFHFILILLSVDHLCIFCPQPSQISQRYHLLTHFLKSFVFVLLPILQKTQINTNKHFFSHIERQEGLWCFWYHLQRERINLRKSALIKSDISKSG